MSWWVYIIECSDGLLYTGVTTQISRRFKEHNGEGGSKLGARFFKGRKPEAVVFLEAQANRSEAQKREAAIKKLKRSEKLRLKQSFIIFTLEPSHSGPLHSEPLQESARCLAARNKRTE